MSGQYLLFLLNQVVAKMTDTDRSAAVNFSNSFVMILIPNAIKGIPWLYAWFSGGLVQCRFCQILVCEGSEAAPRLGHEPMPAPGVDFRAVWQAVGGVVWRRCHASIAGMR